ncbi:LytS/YhcK type 5TM receptor domain-containing protein, partial [Enterococcus faecalis]|uniref:LytS/YhcK type 5TM receptor domain-containing protein n=1 Tax=Enterococcus faecalis TaxID=1351 RepID=UPI002958B460
MNVPNFKCVLFIRLNMSSKVPLSLIIDVFDIIYNFTDIEIAKNYFVPNNLLPYLTINASIANTLTLIICFSGLVGCPIIGSAVSLIAAFHRFIQGGGHSFFYVPASLIVGLIPGFLGSRMA